MEIGKDKQLYIKTKLGLLWIDALEGELDKSSDGKTVGVFTQGDFGNGDIETKVMVVRGPGEYDVSGFHISGWRVGAEGTIYLVESEDLKIALIADLTDKWDKKRQERLGEADVLLVWGKKVGAKKCRELLKNTGANHIIVWPEGDETVAEEFRDEFDLGGEAKVGLVKVEKQNLSESLEVLILNEA